MKNEICAILINPPVFNVQWRKCNSNYFYFKCAGSLFEHSVSEQKITPHKKGHSLYEKDKKPTYNHIYTSTNTEFWLTDSAVIAGSTLIWEHKIPIHRVLISLYLSVLTLMCILDGSLWQRTCWGSWMDDQRVKNPDPVCGLATGLFWINIHLLTFSLVSSATLSGLFRRKAPLYLYCIQGKQNLSLFWLQHKTTVNFQWITIW